MRRCKGINILSLEAKDIYVANEYNNEYEIGYSPRYRNGINKGQYNLNKFINTLDYSLDAIKLREVYERKYRNTRFTFSQNSHAYTNRVVNVTFKYSLKRYNKIGSNTFLLLGESRDDIELADHVFIRDGKLIAIETNSDFEKEIPDELLGDSFRVVDGHYEEKPTMEVVKTTGELREYLYENGFLCDGIRFCRFKRSSGSSRVGKCLFLDEKLYPSMHKWELCGLSIKEGQEIDLAAFEAYIALTLSSIVDTIEINPENILLVDDYESVFMDSVIETRLNGTSLLTEVTNSEICNSIWDGQSLMDVSLFGEYSDKGMLLLRNRFFKSCCFNANIQKWFEDNGITDVSQLNGRTIATDIKDIKLITTPSSIKYLKFGSFEQWLDNLESIFGVVKYEKKTHYFDGEMVQTHYQLLNTLQLSENDMREFLKPSLDLLTLMRSDSDVLRKYIKYPIELIDNDEISPVVSKNDIIYKMLGINNKFRFTKLYKEFVKDLSKSYIKNMRKGHILVYGNYSTLCGNPIEMLKQSIGTFNGDSQIGVGNVHSTRFAYDTKILGSRSPHTVQGCVLICDNKENEMIDTYMNPTNEIIYINSIDENILMKLSGCDFDSDTVLITDNEILIRNALKNYDLFKVPTCNVDSVKRKRLYTNYQKCDLDIKTSGNYIGEIINLSQELNTLLWDKMNNGESYDSLEEIYCDTCQLSVMSGLEIDKAKKEFSFSNYDELNRMRAKYHREDDDERNIKPYFFSYIQRYKGYYDNEKCNYLKHDTSMDYLEDIINKYQRGRKYRDTTETIKFADCLRDDGFKRMNIYRDQVSRVLRIVKEYKNNVANIFINQSYDEEERHNAFSDERQKCVEYIGNLRFSNDTMIYMLKTLDNKEYSNIYRTIFNFLFGYPNTDFYKVIESSKEDIYELVEDQVGDIDIFGKKYSKRNLRN